ncbi:MAG: hypothetical protein JRH15_04720 [Deltaproteobacteria bacterium]|nr:hypothetical protein [Deltaproteobacteria bacterium]
MIKKLDASLSAKLTLVSAPAGYGKTTCVSQWAGASKHDVAWFSIDHTDDDSKQFWMYVLTALSDRSEKIGDAALSLLESITQPAIEEVLSVLINDAANLDRPTLLILDDYHLIKKTSISKALDFLIKHLPNHLHLIITSRTTLNLALDPLRVRGELNEIRSPLLKFSLYETDAMMNGVMALSLWDKNIEKLNRLSEGWVAGLQLVALALKGRKDINAYVDDFKGDHHYIANFLVREIFKQQPEKVQQFLLQTAVLDRMCGPLCNQVTEMAGCHAILEDLVERNLFIFPLDDKRKWFRYHSLFHEILLDRQKKINPEILPNLYRRASDWYKNNGNPIEAIRYAFKAGDEDYAANIINKNLHQLVNTGMTETLSEWIKTFSEPMIRRHPGLCIGHAFSMAIDPTIGNVELFEKRIKEAEGILNSGQFGDLTTSDMENLQGVVNGLKAFVFSGGSDSPDEGINFSKSALEKSQDGTTIESDARILQMIIAYRRAGDAVGASRLVEENLRKRSAFKKDIIFFILVFFHAQIKFLQGHLDEAEKICRENIRPIENTDEYFGAPPPVCGMLYTCLGNILLEKNELTAAETYLTKGLGLLKILRDADFLLNGYASVIRLKIAQQYEFSLLSDLIDELGKKTGTGSEPTTAALRIKLFLSGTDPGLEKLSAATTLAEKYNGDLLSQSGPLGIDITGQEHFQLQVQLARLLIFQRRKPSMGVGTPELQPLFKFLGHRLDKIQPRGLTRRLIQIYILKALAKQACREKTAAVSELEKALDLAEPGGFIRLFLDEGPPMLTLLKRAGSQGIQLDYIGRLLKQFGGVGEKIEKKNAPPQLIEPLTDRELQILRLVAVGLSNNDIANELFLAVGTVKKHLYNIFGKLDANNRTQAVARARELAIL